MYICNKAFGKTNYGSYSPNALSQEDIMIIPSVGYIFLQSVDDNVVIVLEGNSHSSRNTSVKGAGLLLPTANRF